MNIRKLLTITGSLLFGITIAFTVGCTSSSLSSTFSYQGVLTDSSGNPVADGTYSVVFRLYTDDTGGTVVYETTKNVTTKNGIFSTTLSPSIEEMHDPLWLDLTVEGEHLPSRQQLLGAPYALSLRHGARIEGPIPYGGPISATLNIANTSYGIGLAVAAVSSTGMDGNEGILAINNASGDITPTLKLSNIEADGRLIEVWNGDGSLDPWDDQEMRVSGGGSIYVDGSFYDSGADYADMIPAGEEVNPGDVLVIGADGTMHLSNNAYATNVAGIYSTMPGYIGGDPSFNTDEKDPEQLKLMASMPKLLTDTSLERVPVALTGVVPCKVSAENGAILPGDLLVTSNTPGHAMKAEQIEVDGVSFYPPGTIIGKAMQAWETGLGKILVLISLN